jgi:hypothetical protein
VAIVQTITNLFQIVKSGYSSKIWLFLLLAAGVIPATAQPGPLQTINIPIQPGTLALMRYTPFALSYYPYYNGVRNDSVARVVGNQITAGTAQTADRIIDVTGVGVYAYRDTSGHWQGTLQTLYNGRAFLYANHHGSRTLALQGYPADSITYIFPMPTGSIRFAAARMALDHPISGIGLSWSGFHWSQNMRQGGDLVIDLVSRQIARRDSTDGWIGTMTTAHVGQPFLIQVNNPSTFDWTYNPTRE